MSGVEFRRHLRLNLAGICQPIEPIFCSEYVTDGNYTFQTDSNQCPPTYAELAVRYPLEFIGYIGTWVSDWTKMLWAKKAKK